MIAAESPHFVYVAQLDPALVLEVLRRLPSGA